MEYTYPYAHDIDLTGFDDFLRGERQGTRYNSLKLASELSDFHGTDCISLTNSGATAALVAALALADKLRRLNKPLTALASAYTYPETLNALLLAGFKVRLIDLEEVGFGCGFNVSLNQLEESGKVSLIVITHFMGFPCKTWNMLDCACRHGALLLQDASQTFEMRERAGYNPQWGYGDMTICDNFEHSMGSIICDEECDTELCNKIINSLPYVQANISELNAIYARWQLSQWESFEKKHIENYSIIFNVLKDNDNLCVWDVPWRTINSPTAFPIRLRKGRLVDEAVQLLSAQGVEVKTVVGDMVIPTEKLPMGITYDNLHNADSMSKTTFAIGIDHVPAENVKAVAEIINQTYTTT